MIHLVEDSMRDYSDSDTRLAYLMEEERANWEAMQVAKRAGRVLVVCGLAWVFVIGVWIVWK